MEKKITEGCAGCRWLCSMGGYWGCDYFDWNGNGLRGCPPGVGCIRYEKKQKKKPILKGKRKMTKKEMNEWRMDLYMKGCTDSEIASKVGVSTEAICAWRKLRNLAANPKAKTGEQKGKTKKAAVIEEPAAEIIEEQAVDTTEWPEQELVIEEVPDATYEELQDMVNRLSSAAVELSNARMQMQDMQNELEKCKTEYFKLLDSWQEVNEENTELKRWLNTVRSLVKSMSLVMEVNND